MRKSKFMLNEEALNTACVSNPQLFKAKTHSDAQLIDAPSKKNGTAKFIKAKFKNSNRVKLDPSLIKRIVSSALTPIDFIVLFSTFLILTGAVVTFVLVHPQIEEIHIERASTSWGMILIVISISLLAFRLVFFVFLVILNRKYKPVESVADELLPICTVIVPAYNEGKLVWQTLHSLANSHYPIEKIQLIAIDDGSKDDTWEWMKKAKQDLGNRVEIYQQPKNMGKRAALYRGFKMASGEIFVTVDSDSIVENDTLRNLVSPFVINEKCGAVAGNVRVLNVNNAMIPRMLNVSFTFSFEFIRSAQSVLNSVLCTPGALAAYRKTAVMACLNDWVNQTFMGRKTDIGEDRAMTNMILKQGYNVNFQSNAHVLTDVPEKYKNLYKMFIRWGRSNVRENIKMSQFAFTNYREDSKFGPRFLLINQWLSIITAYPAILLMIIFTIMYPIIFGCAALVGILIFSSIPAIYYAKKYSISGSFWAYTYGLFHTFALFWITPYAIVTASRRGWLTRGLPGE